jgi:peptidoglycan/LPS O-acetylase OafA/YrhL
VSAATAIRSDPAPASPAPARRLATGDPLRGLAVLAVVALHAATGAVFVTGHLAGAGGTLYPNQAFGPVAEVVLETLPVAVYVFFALSGLLISRPFVEAFIAGRPMPSLGRYVRNRALRLFPAAWVLLAFVLLRHGTRDATTDQVVSMLTLTEAYTSHPLGSLVGQLWSVRVELCFYLAVPVGALALHRPIGARLSPAGRRRAVHALVFACVGVGMVSALRPHLDVGDVHGISYLIPAFMPGVALAAALAGHEPGGRPRRRWRAGAGGAFVAGLLLALPAGAPGTFEVWQTSLFATAAAGLIVAAPVVLEATGGVTWRWLDNGVLQWVGVRSYGIYLWHLVLMSELYALVRGMPGYKDVYVILLPATVLASCLVAGASWRLVEQPALRLKRRPARRPGAPTDLPQPAAAVPAVAAVEA